MVRALRAAERRAFLRWNQLSPPLPHIDHTFAMTARRLMSKTNSGRAGHSRAGCGSMLGTQTRRSPWQLPPARPACPPTRPTRRLCCLLHLAQP